MKLFDRLLTVAFWLAVAFLFFLAGNFTAHFNLPPNQFISDAIVAAKAWYQKEKTIMEARQESDANFSIRNSEVLRKEGAYEGYTLFTVVQKTMAELVDMNGNVVHQWSRAFSDTWHEAPQVDTALPDSRITWRDVYLYPNGDLLAVYEALGDTPYGYGLCKIDKDSRLIWSVDDNIHHRIHVDQEGKIYALSHKTTKVDPESERAFLGSRIIEDWALVLSPEGKTLIKISLVDALLRSPYAYLLREPGNNIIRRNNNRRSDVLHANSVVALEANMASAFPKFKPGQLLISMRNIHTVGVLDIESQTFVWASRGPWAMQHDAEYSPDGTIVVFDNRGSKEKRSRILKYNPQTDAVTVAYEGKQHREFYSAMRGMQQLLPNGNFLITESGRGRIFEVTPEQEIVWQFLNPHFLNEKRLTVVVGKRYAADELTFLKEKTK